VGVALSRSYLVPDLVVAERARIRGASMLRPADVLLVVEIVSPGSVSMDRLVKPAQYAAAGIPAYWRVETDPVSLTAYTLPFGTSSYAEVGTWTSADVVRLAEPFPVEIDLARLVVGG
jgi:Uma2 family endonuclease